MNPSEIAGQSLVRIRISEPVTLFRSTRSPCWYCQYNVDGRQFKPSLKTRSQKQATILAKKIDAELTLGITPAKRKRAVTIPEATTKYLSSQQVHISTKSLTLYRRDLDQFATFSAEQRIARLIDVTAEHLEDFENRLRTQGAPRIRRYPKKRKAEEEKKVRRGPNQPKTIRSKMKTIRQMIRWAVKRRLIEHDPAPGYRSPPEVRARPEPFSAGELKTILDTAAPPFKDVFNFFRLTGLRSDELCWLLKRDVDPELRFIHVREKTCPFTGEAWRPKHGNERIVPLCREAQEIAKQHLAANNAPWLFVAPDTWGKRPGQFKKGRIWTALKQVPRKAGITHGTVHTFRHCFCSFLANQNVSPFLVMKFMGHSSLDIVMTYYHAATQDLLSGISSVSFDRMLEGKATKTSEVSVNDNHANQAISNTTS